MIEFALVVAVVGALVASGLAAWWWASCGRVAAELAGERLQHERTRAELAEARAQAQAERTRAEAEGREWRGQVETARAEAATAMMARAQLEERLEAAVAQHRADLEARGQVHQRELQAVRAAKEEVERAAREVVATSGERFKALAADVLREAGEQLRKQTGAEHAVRSASIETMVGAMVGPMKELLERTRTRLDELQKEQAGSMGRIGAEIRALAESGAALRQETGRLVQAMKRPEIRGRYGEIQLERVAELSGMRSYCDFSTQESVRDEQGRLQRPDMVVRLPGDRQIAVDAKTNIAAYLEAMEAGTPEAAEEKLRKFAEDVRQQAIALSKKEYWARYEGSPEFVVMFVPGDQFVDAALARCPDLLQMAAERNVILASPSTLIGLLRAVSVGWRQRQVEQEAKVLMALGRELHERTAVLWEKVGALGDSLRMAVGRYNEVVGSAEGRLIATMRKFEETGARSSKEIAEVEPLSVETRRMRSLPEGTRE
jgi:DNA recombination protein RmuC